MMYVQQIGERAVQQSSVVLDTSTEIVERPSGLLGNLWVQTPTRSVTHSVSEISDWPTFSDWTTLSDSFHATWKLEVLKQQQFRSTERQRRIQNSLAALNANQPTTLPLASWKAIVEEVEDEDED